MGGRPSSNRGINRAQSFGFVPGPSFSPAPSSAESSNSCYDKMQDFNTKWRKIGDNYKSVEQVTRALAEAGLESSNLIVAIDFTKSNEWTGKKSFNAKCLHHVGEGLNPYESAISIIGRTLSTFDEDNLIPCFGFGDVTTHDQQVFSFYPDNRPCYGFEQALSRYREIVKQVRLAGPTSFAPAIDAAIGIVNNSGGLYHVLLIIADGQVTRSIDTKYGQFSPQERNTIDAIVKASEYPLSIVVVGVGDGPWDVMKEFDDNIPARAFDNIQFVNFTEIMARNTSLVKREADFALAALMEIPDQYKATIDLQLLGNQKSYTPKAVLPPPSPKVTPIPSAPNFPVHSQQNCPVCSGNRRDVALGCGHTVCHECSMYLYRCPVCNTEITTRLKLYQ